MKSHTFYKAVLRQRGKHLITDFQRLIFNILSFAKETLENCFYTTTDVCCTNHRFLIKNGTIVGDFISLTASGGARVSILFIIGTRPEAIKMLPLYLAFKHAGLPVFLCNSSQHKSLLDEPLASFGVTPDYTLQLSPLRENLNSTFAEIIQHTNELLQQNSFEWIFVQGDTATVCAAAIAAFNRQIKIAHIEAGLRTFDLHNPFPEEGYRAIVSKIATHHYAPTATAVKNLLNEQIAQNAISLVGNTVIDAMHLMLKKISSNPNLISKSLASFCTHAQAKHKKIFLLTAHRREAHGENLEIVFSTIKQFLLDNPNTACIYPTHPNPAVQKALQHSGLISAVPPEQLFFSPPLGYPDLIYALDRATCVATDSGGIQEEALALGKPVICLRKKTERTEGISAGLTIVTGFDPIKITDALAISLNTKHSSNKSPNIYGDGTSCQQILTHFVTHFISLTLTAIKQTHGETAP
jgi:UDP-N-acetylglucosamine 2-epimerase (non-hydrolysing)